MFKFFSSNHGPGITGVKHYALNTNQVFLHSLSRPTVPLIILGGKCLGKWDYAATAIHRSVPMDQWNYFHSMEIIGQVNQVTVTQLLL